MNLSSTNGLRVKIKKDYDGTLWAKAECETETNKSLSYVSPISQIDEWYPLTFYYDYYYIDAYKDIMLLVDENAPKHLVDIQKNKRYHLKDFINENKDKIKENFIYEMNHAIELKLQTLGMITWSEEYNIDDVKNNAEKLGRTISVITNDCLERQYKDSNSIIGEVNEDTYAYASDNELIMLSDIGMGVRMNNIMRKISIAKGA